MSNELGLNRAFNRGADARLAGEPVSVNPFTDYDTLMASYFTRGWNEVNKNWGKDAKWWVKPLPPIRETVMVDS